MPDGKSCLGLLSDSLGDDMHRDKQVNKAVTPKGAELFVQMAYHEAGHAAAIYLRNKQLNLPQIYFHILLTGFNRPKCETDAAALPSLADCQAKLEGGLLIHSLAMSVNSNATPREAQACQMAYEADIINLLTGPLAEAKHIAQRDGEPINARLMNIEALKNYGGKSDLEKIDEYLEIFCPGQEKKAEKLAALFSAAFSFIDQPDHWRAVTQLAHFICTHEKELIRCEDAIAVLDTSIEKACLSKQW